MTRFLDLDRKTNFGNPTNRIEEHDCVVFDVDGQQVVKTYFYEVSENIFDAYLSEALTIEPSDLIVDLSFYIKDFGKLNKVYSNLNKELK